jgi:Arc/MetJ-type ribon-helix-helix transcriptional regulator
VATAKPISELELAWKWTVPDGFVLWPVIHPPSAGPFDRFAFKRLSDVYDQEKRDVLAEIGSGRFRSADDALRRLQRLLSMFDDPSSKFIPGVSMGELEYKLLQDVCTAAHKFRATQGRSKVSDDEIENERRWRKGQFAAAIRSEQPDRALVRSLNAWADFSREVYSRAQRTWPNRQLSESADVLEQRHYVAWLREDVESVIEQLSWLRGELGQPTLNHRLSSRRRAALDDVLSGSADQVSMSQLVDLLSALVDPYRPTPTPTE